MSMLRINRTLLISIFLVLFTLTSLWSFYHFRSEINSGIISCGGSGGQGGSIVLNAKQIQMEGSSFDTSGGRGGDCNIYLSIENKLGIYEFVSLICSILSIVVDSIFIYDKFHKKPLKNP